MPANKAHSRKTVHSNVIHNGDVINSNSDVIHNGDVISSSSDVIHNGDVITKPFSLPDGRIAQPCPLIVKPVLLEKRDFSFYLDIHHAVRSYGNYNFMGARIPLKHNTFDISVWRHELTGTPFEEIADYLEFGFPLGTQQNKVSESTLKNHSSAFEYFEYIDKFIKKERDLKGLAGPFSTSPFWLPIISPLMTAPKKPDSLFRPDFWR